MRDLQRELTRNVLVKTALRLFGEKGYAYTTVDDIASTAGATRPTFYLHFASKGDLMRALIIEVDTILTSADDPPLAVVIESGDRAKIGAWLARKFDQFPVIQPYVQAANDAAASERDIALAVRQWFEMAIGEIKLGLDRAGRFDPATRHIRSVLAFGQLEFLSRRWMHFGWDHGRPTALLQITDSWCYLLAEQPD